MDITARTIWQQAAGDTDRDYSDLCLRWDVILNGPGYCGPWPTEDALLADEVSPRKVACLRRFCEEMREGDLVVLRLGTSQVLGVGEVVGPYQWLEAFGDVDGWDVQHTRRVRWLWKHGGEPARFATYALKQGDTTQLLNPASPVTEWLTKLEVPSQATKRPLADLSVLDGHTGVSLEQVSEYLFDQGVASASIGSLLQEVGELVRIAKWYQRTDNPSEPETIAYLVVPLLRALGWTPQRMAIEWNYVDIALFDQLPRIDKTLAVAVEVKKMDASCLSAMSQALEYARDRANCQRLIVTDGLRYGIYVREKSGAFTQGLYAYLNLADLRGTYGIYQCLGAREALLAMTPEWKPPT